MRDISDYERQYTSHAFERTQEKYRRRLAKDAIEKYAKTGDCILEIGCGLEPLFADYHDEYFFVVVEPAQQYYENACVQAEKYENVSCCQGFFEDVIEQIKGKKVDIVICSSLLHEVEDPRTLLRGISQLCNQQTVVHINVPNAYSFHRLLAKEMGLLCDVHQMSDSNRVLQQHEVFDMESLTGLIMSEGYTVLDSGSAFLKPFTHQQMQQCLDTGILNEEILNALDRMCDSVMKDYGSEIYLNMRHSIVCNE